MEPEQANELAKVGDAYNLRLAAAKVLRERKVNHTCGMGWSRIECAATDTLQPMLRVLLDIWAERVREAAGKLERAPNKPETRPPQRIIYLDFELTTAEEARVFAVAQPLLDAAAAAAQADLESYARAVACGVAVPPGNGP